jgi:hypothetical protein
VNRESTERPRRCLVDDWLIWQVVEGMAARQWEKEKQIDQKEI